MAIGDDERERQWRRYVDNLYPPLRMGVEIVRDLESNAPSIRIVPVEEPAAYFGSVLFERADASDDEVEPCIAWAIERAARLELPEPRVATGWRRRGPVTQEELEDKLARFLAKVRGARVGRVVTCVYRNFRHPAREDRRAHIFPGGIGDDDPF